MDTIEREAVKLTAMLLAATENFPSRYNKAPEQHAQLLRSEAEMQVTLTRLYRSMAKKAGNFVNWDQYHHQLNMNPQKQLDKTMLDYNVDVIVNNQQIDNWDGVLIKVIHQTINDLIIAGAQSGELTYKRPLGIQAHDAIIQKLTTKQVAKLVGKRVLPDGSIIDNPNAKYNVNETVRNDIAESVKTSLALGETDQEATDRMRNIIDDPNRAKRIAATESVNAYNAGITEFGEQSGAVGMEWEDAGADDICSDYASEGPIEINSDWDGLDGPPAHPNCRCIKRLIYQEEWDSNGYGNSNSGNTRPTGIAPQDLAE